MELFAPQFLCAMKNELITSQCPKGRVCLCLETNYGHKNAPDSGEIDGTAILASQKSLAKHGLHYSGLRLAAHVSAINFDYV